MTPYGDRRREGVYAAPDPKEKSMKRAPRRSSRETPAPPAPEPPPDNGDDDEGTE